MKGIATYVIAQFFKETFDFTNHSNHCRGDIALASINIVFPEYCGFTCLKIIRCKKTSILAKVKFNHL
jgi:hypothetical protein